MSDVGVHSLRLFTRKERESPMVDLRQRVYK